MKYRYKLISTSYSSHRFGMCEVCGKFASHVFHQIEESEYEPNKWTRYQCVDLFGHKECLINRRRSSCGAGQVRLGISEVQSGLGPDKANRTVATT